jgi:hypothetical protein
MREFDLFKDTCKAIRRLSASVASEAVLPFKEIKILKF